MWKLFLTLCLPAGAYLLTPELKAKFDAENARGVALHKEGRYLEAAEVFAAAERELAHGEPLLLINAADSYYKAGRYALANNYHDELLRQKHAELQPAFRRQMIASYAHEDRWAQAADAADDSAVDWKAAAMWANGASFDEAAAWWAQRSGNESRAAFGAAIQKLLISSARSNEKAGGKYVEIMALAKLARFRADCGRDCHPHAGDDYPREQVYARIGALQSAVPLKLAPSKAAIEWARRGRAAAGTDWQAAADAYGRAVLESPWWAEAHFDRAVALLTISGGEYGGVQSLRAYLAFKPKGSRARTAKKLLKKWSKLTGY